MYPTLLLRIEGLAVVAAALATHVLEGSFWLLALLALAPDLAMVGYLAGASGLDGQHRRRYGLKHPTAFSDTHLRTRTPEPAHGSLAAAPGPAD